MSLEAENWPKGVEFGSVRDDTLSVAAWDYKSLGAGFSLFWAHINGLTVVNCTYLALGLQSSGIFDRIDCVYPGCQTHINCERNQIICDAIAIIRPGSH